MSEVRSQLALLANRKGKKTPPSMQSTRRSVESVVKRFFLARKREAGEARVLVVEWVGKQKSVGHVSPRDFSRS